MAEPNLVKSQAPRVVKKEAQPKQLSAQDIEEKLRAAEQRRLVREKRLFISYKKKSIFHFSS